MSSKSFLLRSISRFVFGTAFVVSAAACSHQPILPDAKNVKVQREDPSPKCVDFGQVTGTVSSSRGTLDEAIEDMKLDAARKGANFVKVESTGAMGTSITGHAYNCP